MKKFLCFLGILGLIVLIAIPPTLRILVPKDNKEEEKKEELIIKALSCDSNTYVARTRYENDVIKMILIKKNAISNEENNEDNSTETPSLENQEENLETQDESEDQDNESQEEGETNPPNPEVSSDIEKFEQLFTRLSEDSRVVKNEMEDGVSLTIDFSIYDNLDLNIENITKPINDQKIYYEDLGLVCSIIE